MNPAPRAGQKEVERYVGEDDDGGHERGGHQGPRAAEQQREPGVSNARPASAVRTFSRGRTLSARAPAGSPSYRVSHIHGTPPRCLGSASNVLRNVQRVIRSFLTPPAARSHCAWLPPGRGVRDSASDGRRATGPDRGGVRASSSAGKERAWEPSDHGAGGIGHSPVRERSEALLSQSRPGGRSTGRAGSAAGDPSQARAHQHAGRSHGGDHSVSW